MLQDPECTSEERESGGGGFGDHDFEPKQVKLERKRRRPKKLDESASMPDEEDDVFVHDDDDDDYEGYRKWGKNNERERVLEAVTCKICGKTRSKEHMARHLKLVHKVELEMPGRGRSKEGQKPYGYLDEYIELPKKQEECIGLDEYMPMVEEKENKFIHDDEEYDMEETANTPEVAARPNKCDEGGRKLEVVTCKFCGEELSKNGQLERHIRSFHPEVELKKNVIYDLARKFKETWKKDHPWVDKTPGGKACCLVCNNQVIKPKKDSLLKHEQSNKHKAAMNCYELSGRSTGMGSQGEIQNPLKFTYNNMRTLFEA